MEKLAFITPKKIFIAGIISLILAVGTCVYLGYKYTSLQHQSVEEKAAADKAEAEKETKKVVRKLEDMILLPKEEPLLATVTDKEKLKGQEFFRNAENGDKVLIYQQANKAILYRPSINKIVEVSIVNSENRSPTGTVAGAQTSSPATGAAKISPTVPVISLAPGTLSIFIYDGAVGTGRAEIAEKQIKDNQELPVVVTGKSSANKNIYSGILIVDLTHKNPELTHKLASILKGSLLSVLPEGESDPGSDILIIVGK